MLPPGAEGLEPTATLELMLAGFGRASDRLGLIERRYRFGGHVVALRFAGPALLDALTPAIEHLRTDAGPAEVTLSCWDSATSGEALSPLVSLLLGRIDHDWFGWLTPRLEVRGISNGRVPCVLEPWHGILSVYDRATDRGVWWIADAAAVPSHERAAPARSMLSWALADRGRQSVHAAAVGRADGGVLLVGPGGSGKSTTALRCLEAGLGHLADDYCLVSTQGGPTAHSLYAVGKVVGADDLARLASMQDSVINPEQLGLDKQVIDLRRHHADRLLHSFPVRAVVVPRVEPDRPTSLEPLRPAAALRALCPTTLLQRPGAAGEALLTMGDLVRRVPCFALHLGPDRDAVVPLIEGLLA